MQNGKNYHKHSDSKPQDGGNEGEPLEEGVD